MGELPTQVRYELRSFLSSYPRVFLPGLRWLGRNKSRFISESTKLVIEGFPRSGNTFTCAAFNYAQLQKVETACHMHAPAQVVRAVGLSIPTLVIVRRPKDAVVAWKLTHQHLSLKQLLRGYVRYHKAIQPYADQCVIATFDQVTADLGEVIERINARFNTNFEIFKHTKENVDSVFKVLETVAYERIPDRKFVETIPIHPSERERQRENLKDQFSQLQATRQFKLATRLFEFFELRSKQ